jgi:hypothetical protein
VIEGQELPENVLAAYERAARTGFRLACEVEVSGLLAALAAAVPGGGRVLEIGTGVGVGLAWLVHDLGARQDVEVVIPCDRGTWRKAQHRNVKGACELLKVSRAAYYAAPDGQPSPRDREDVGLAVLIEEEHKRSRGCHGAPRINAELRRKGRRHFRKRIARLMRQAGLLRGTGAGLSIQVHRGRGAPAPSQHGYCRQHGPQNDPPRGSRRPMLLRGRVRQRQVHAKPAARLLPPSRISLPWFQLNTGRATGASRFIHRLVVRMSQL